MKMKGSIDVFLMINRSENFIIASFNNTDVLSDN